jgi:hypothetical protein
MPEMDREQILNDQEEATRMLLEGSQVGIWTAIPGIIQSVDLGAMTCVVQPAIKSVILDQNGTPTEVPLPLLLDVPIVFPKGGGFVLSFPVAVNDEVLVVFSSRCIDAWWQSGGVQQAMEARMHDLSDGFAIPGVYSQPSVASASISATEARIAKQDGTSYVSLDSSGKVKMLSPSEVNVTAPTINLNGIVNVSGALTCASIGTSGSGSATIGGALTAASVVSGGTNLHTHVHSGVSTGGSDTGPPV